MFAPNFTYLWTVALTPLTLSCVAFVGGLALWRFGRTHKSLVWVWIVLFGLGIGSALTVGNTWETTRFVGRHLARVNNKLDAIITVMAKLELELDKIDGALLELEENVLLATFLTGVRTKAVHVRAGVEDLSNKLVGVNFAYYGDLVMYIADTIEFWAFFVLIGLLGATTAMIMAHFLHPHTTRVGWFLWLVTCIALSGAFYIGMVASSDFCSNPDRIIYNISGLDGDVFNYYFGLSATDPYATERASLITLSGELPTYETELAEIIPFLQPEEAEAVTALTQIVIPQAWIDTLDRNPLPLLYTEAKTKTCNLSFFTPFILSLSSLCIGLFAESRFLWIQWAT